MYRDRKETRLQRSPNEIAAEKTPGRAFLSPMRFPRRRYPSPSFYPPLFAPLYLFLQRIMTFLFSDIHFQQFLSHDSRISENHRIYHSLCPFLSSLSLSPSFSTARVSDISFSRKSNLFLTQASHRRLDNCRGDAEFTTWSAAGLHYGFHPLAGGEFNLLLLPQKTGRA